MARYPIHIRVAGDTFVCEQDELEIHDAETERHQVAAMVVWWGSVAASAEAHEQRLTVQFGQWRNEAIAACIGKDERVAEWKAKAVVDGHHDAKAWGMRIADAHEEVGKAKAIYWGLVRKMGMLEAMLGGEHASRRSANQIGRAPEQEIPEESTRATGDHRVPGNAISKPTDPRLKAFQRNRTTNR